MNINHANLCPSPEWAAHIQNEVLPFLTRDVDLGSEMIELGPGPGAATEWLRGKVKQLTAVEVEEAAAALLAERYADANVRVVVGSAAELDFADESFDSAGCFTMLHHVPTLAMQNKIFAEAFRVLRPGGVLIGSDSLASNGLHHFHSEDTYNPIEPSSVLSRLQTVGFDGITIVVDGILKFIAHKPTGEEHECGRNASADDREQAEASTP
jgi:ubiquinone/menaquinone biosynthesis C-methylase UbiE